MPSFKKLTPVLIILALAACSRRGDFDETGGIRTVRSACPAIAIPAYTGDVTLFDPPGSREARAIDVVATLTDVRTTCNEVDDKIVASATFDVLARRANASGPRDVVLPYFATVTRGGTKIVSKQVGRVALHFADGQLRAQTRGSASATILKAEAALPPAVEARINRKRKAGDFDAAVDPLTEPAIRDALLKASFELLIGFELSNDQLAYNATR